MTRRWMLVTREEREIVEWHRRHVERIKRAVKARTKGKK